MDSRVLSLFTGAAGLDVGLEEAGYDVSVCVEQNRERCEILSRNRPEWPIVNQDIRNVTGRALLRLARLKKHGRFIISGAAPCGAFSKAAFWLPYRFTAHRRDPRRTLLFEFARIVSQTRPVGFIFENVASLSYAPNRRYLTAFLRLIRKAGYTTSMSILDASQYGIAQKRDRLFIVGSRDGIRFVFPRPTRTVSCEDAIGHLDNGVIRDDERLGGKWGHLLDEVPPGDNYQYFTRKRGYPKPIFRWRSRYYSFLAKLSPKKPSWTIPASPAYYGGPFHWGSRRLRIKEVRLLQTYPENWWLPGSYAKAWAAIGDATPRHLAKIIGREMQRQCIA